jgi:hypothetical protein
VASADMEVGVSSDEKVHMLLVLYLFEGESSLSIRNSAQAKSKGLSMSTERSAGMK